MWTSGPKWILSCCSYFPNQITLQIECIFSFEIVAKTRDPTFRFDSDYDGFCDILTHTRCIASCWKSVFRWPRPIKSMPISCGHLLKLDCSEASGTIPRNQSLSGSLLWSAKSLASLLFYAAESVSNMSHRPKTQSKTRAENEATCWHDKVCANLVGMLKNTEPHETSRSVRSDRATSHMLVWPARVIVSVGQAGVSKPDCCEIRSLFLVCMLARWQYLQGSKKPWVVRQFTLTCWHVEKESFAVVLVQHTHTQKQFLVHLQ